MNEMSAPIIDRRDYVGGSEVAALFGLHPHVTRFELYHRKRGSLPEHDLSDDNRVQAGIHLEPAIAAWVAAKTGWNLRKVHRHIARNGLGGHLDYEIVGHERGPGVLEIKTVDWLVFRDWPEGEPPIHYLLQLQAYLTLTGRAWGAIAVLVGGNDLRIFEYERRPKIVAKIEAAVAEFWADANAGREPRPDWHADAEAIGQLYRAAGGGLVDMTNDNYLADLCGRYAGASARESAARADKDAAKAEILTKIGVADKVLAPGFTISAATVAAKDISYTREAYRAFRVTEKSAAKEAA